MRNGVPVSVGRALEELRKYTRGLHVMGGGLTISGGDPLMQDRFVVKVLQGAQALGIHTAIETNGFFGDRLTDVDLGPIDLVMLGLKAWDPARHRDLTGRDIDATLAFAKRLAALGKPIWVPFVLVPGLTDDPGEIAGIARFAASLGNVQRSRGAAVSPDGPLQVGAARDPLSAERHGTPDQRVGRAGLSDLPGRGSDRGLTQVDE
jgi:pyruvate formate lyase activating enzyme